MFDRATPVLNDMGPCQMIRMTSDKFLTYLFKAKWLPYERKKSVIRDPENTLCIWKGGQNLIKSDLKMMSNIKI